MPANVIVPIDGSEQAYGGLTYTFESFPTAEVTSLHVIDVQAEWSDIEWRHEPWEDRARETARRYHDRAESIAGGYGADIATETVMGVPHKEILAHAADGGVDHITMGSHGRSPITGPFVGHVTEAVVRRAPTPVSIVPMTPGELSRIQLPGRVLVPTDGSGAATAALEFALTSFPGASLTALSVIELDVDEPPERLEGTYVYEQYELGRERAEAVLADAEELASEHDHDLDTRTVTGRPKHAIVDVAVDDGFDQIVIGSHGRSRIARAVLGSVAAAVVQRSPVPVTVVR